MSRRDRSRTDGPFAESPPAPEGRSGRGGAGSGQMFQDAAGHLAFLTARAAGAPASMIHLLDGDDLRLVGSSNGPAWQPASGPASATLSAQVVSAGLPVVVTDLTTDPLVHADPAELAAGTRAYAGFPIRDPEGRVAGVCAVLDSEPRTWDSAQLSAVDHGAQACTAFVVQERSYTNADRARRFVDALLASLHSCVAGCDADGRLVFANAAIRQFGGSLPDGMDLRAWTDGQLAGDPAAPLPPVLVPLARALDGEHLREAEIMVSHPTQRPSFMSADAQPITDAGGEPLGAVVALLDVTRARRTAVLKDCELEVRRILSGPDTGTVDELLTAAITAIGTMLDWAAAEFWGIDEVGNVLRREISWAAADLPPWGEEATQLGQGQGLPGRAWQTSETVWSDDLRTDPDALAQCPEWGALRSAATVPVPIGSLTRGVLSCYSVYTEHPDDARTAVMTGIAAHIGQFLERRHAQELSVELDRSRDEYIALVGHEIRTPLTSIGSYTGLMLDDPAMPLEQRVTLLHVVRRNVGKLHTIIDKLLDIAGLQAGRITVEPQPIDLTDVVRAGTAAAQEDVAGKTVHLDLELPPQAPLWGDPRRLQQVVEELLANAFTWANDGGRVTVAVTTDGATTQLAVSNTGPTISDADRERMFQRFFRTTAAGLGGIPGTGLGLSLARTIVEQHGGTITATAETAPEGTTLTVRLPTDPPAPPTPASTAGPA